MICDNVGAVSGRIQNAAKKSGRNPEDIKLVVVTKDRTLEEIKEAISCGVADIGENKVQEAKEKYSQLMKVCHPEGAHSLRSVQAARPKDLKILRPFGAQDDRVHWHMVGHLQTNKVRDAVRLFDLMHSLDSLKLAKVIDKEAAKINKIQDVLIEVNTSGEAAKFGIRPDGLIGLVKEVISLKNINLLGLMTIAPIVKDKEEARPYFAKLRQLLEEVNKFLSTTDYGLLTTLSMGMSQDYEVAIEEGATMVRIGTAIFEG